MSLAKVHFELLSRYLACMFLTSFLGNAFFRPGLWNMLDFEKYVTRHGESWVQSVIEQIERADGIRGRWNALMNSNRAVPQILTV
jgi:hypothetical protein